MGLDSVELEIEIEDSFGITLTDEEGSNLETVGDLVELVHSRLQASPRQALETARVELEKWVRKTIGRDVAIDDLNSIDDELSSYERRLLWKKLPEIIGTTPAPLRLPIQTARVLKIVTASFFILAFAPVLIVNDAEVIGGILCITLFLAFLAAGLTHMLFSPFRSRPPDEWQTWEEIIHRIAGTRASTTGYGPMSREQVFADVKQILIHQLELEDDEVTLKARFIQDLGLA